MIRSRSFVIRDKAFSVQAIADWIRISMILASSGYALSISEYVYLLLKALKLRSLVKSLLSKKFEYSSYKDDEARKTTASSRLCSNCFIKVDNDLIEFI